VLRTSTTAAATTTAVSATTTAAVTTATRVTKTTIRQTFLAELPVESFHTYAAAFLAVAVPRAIGNFALIVT